MVMFKVICTYILLIVRMTPLVCLFNRLIENMKLEFHTYTQTLVDIFVLSSFN